MPICDISASIQTYIDTHVNAKATSLACTPAREGMPDLTVASEEFIERGRQCEVYRQLCDEGWQGTDRSAEILGVATRLYIHGFQDSEVLTLLGECDEAWQMALDHRHENPSKAMEYLWFNVCVKAREHRRPTVSEAFRDLSIPMVPAMAEGSTDPLGWTVLFTASEEEIEALADPVWIHPDLIILGHLIVIPGEPNSGKTTIMEWVACQISGKYRVIYVNADISGGDAKTAYQKARDGGYELLLPDLKAGRSMTDVVDQLVMMNQVNADLSGVVLICDTLKKMTDVISKSASRTLYATLRGLTAKGMTIILLAHTNKYRGEDGLPVYEGTGDLRSDVDEMIYLIPEKHDDGSLTVSTHPDKVRGKFGKLTFRISPNREVEQVGYVDVLASRRRAEQREKDSDEIEIINEFLANGAKNQTEIVEHCGRERVSRRRVLNVLKRYTSVPEALWRKTLGRENNATLYSRLNDLPPGAVPVPTLPYLSGNDEQGPDGDSTGGG